jgi:rRNA maturation RNase YbeY
LNNIFINTESKLKVKKRTVKNIILALANEFGIKDIFIEVNFVSSDTLLRINKKYLHHNYRTDIITFDYSNERNILDGEILISLEDAWKNSKSYKVSFDNEVMRLVIHGILHLLGFDDITNYKRKKMKALEDKLINKLEKIK